MKYLRSHFRRRWLARLLVFLMLAPNLMWAPPARAQRSTPSVFVLDFNNRTTVGGALLGRVAAAQLALELTEASQNWDLIPGSQVQNRIQALNLRPPYDRIDRVRIANGVDATAIIYGSITDVLLTQGATPQAQVKIQVLVEDVYSGELINGAIAEGRSTPRMGFTGDADLLLEEALGKAAFQARAQMDRFRLPEGTVLNTTVVGGTEDQQTDALINIGARQGVRRGMEMVVTRLRDTVGRVRVTMVDADISTVRVTQNIQGVRPEDRVRAVFNFADFPITRSRQRSAAPESPLRVAALPGGEKPAPAADAKQGSVRIARAPRGSEFISFRSPQEGGTQLVQNSVQPPPPVVVDEPEAAREEVEPTTGQKLVRSGAVRMLVGGLLLVGILAVAGRGGSQNTRPHGLEATPFQLAIGQPTAALRVRWDRPRSVKPRQVVQYVVFRTGGPGSADFRQIVAALNSEAQRSFVDTEQTRTVVGAFDGPPGNEDDDAGGRVDVVAPGIVPGVQYRYEVATVFRAGEEDRDGDGTPDTGELFISPLSGTSPWATALRPPSVVRPVQGEQVDLSELVVEWAQTPGADTYVILVSSDPNFPNNRTVRRGPFNDEVPVDLGGPPTITRTINVLNQRLANSRTVFVAVGAQNSQDRNKPISPIAGFIVSAPVGVRPETAPPPPPGGAAANARARGKVSTGGAGAPAGGSGSRKK